MNFDNTRFDVKVDEAASEAIDNHFDGSAPNDADVVDAIADSVFDGYVDSLDDDDDASEDGMVEYFESADLWIPTVNEFTDAETKRFIDRGRELFRGRF
jgi:hypothetical protein